MNDKDRNEVSQRSAARVVAASLQVFFAIVMTLVMTAGAAMVWGATPHADYPLLNDVVGALMALTVLFWIPGVVIPAIAVLEDALDNL